MKIYVHILLVAIIFIFNNHNTKAQINEKGFPNSFNFISNKKIKNLQAIIMPAIDINVLNSEDSIQNNSTGAKPFRFAKGTIVNFALDNSGVWDTLSTGDRIWRLKIKSPGAYSINILFSEYEIPDGAKVFIYNTDTTKIIGAFTSKNNSASKLLATQPVWGDEIIVEYFEPVNWINQSTLTIGIIGHDYKGIFRNQKIQKGISGSLSCEVDINCSDGNNLQTEKGSVAKITYLIGSDTYLCTGSLINNTKQDGTPYFLTANHCICNQASAATVIVYFNFERPLCSSGIGSDSQTISGATLKANWAGSDFSLLQLSSIPLQYLKPYFLGWNRSSTNPFEPAYCIHHPQGDVKKISSTNGSITAMSINSYSSSASCDVNINKDVWYVTQWTTGTTEGGSSGASLLDNNHEIVGQLYSGNLVAICNGTSTFGRFSTSWNGNNTPETQLKFWLDPTNSGVITLTGNFSTITSGLNKVYSTRGNGCEITYTVSPNPANNKVKITPTIPAPCNMFTSLNNGFILVYDCLGSLKKKMRYKVGDITEIDVSDLSTGVYQINICDGAKTTTKSIIVQR